jgi:hypothetical protein
LIPASIFFPVLFGAVHFRTHLKDCGVVNETVLSLCSSGKNVGFGRWWREAVGPAIAERLSAEGANVFITSRRRDDAEKAVKGIGSGAVGITADASSPEDMVVAVETVRNAYGRIQAVVC